MSIYFYEETIDVKDKLLLFGCDYCGSINLKNLYESESDHRDVLRFKCNNCSSHPYFSHKNVEDAIKLTKDNSNDIFLRVCEQCKCDPKTSSFKDEILKIINEEI